MKAEKQAGHVLEIARTFAAPRELLFEAWTSPGMVKNWWGCNEFPASHMEMDVRPGGAWSGCLRADDGSEIWLDGKFIEVVPPERLVFTFTRKALPQAGLGEVNTRVTVTFTGEGKNTLMQFRQEHFATAELRDAHRNGWSTGMDRLDKIFAAQ